jgi:beta-N-acetylhexosaminidase
MAASRFRTMNRLRTSWRTRSLSAAVVALTLAGLAAACTPPPSTTTVRDRMTEAQRVGQLFMVGSPATGTNLAVVGDVINYHVGSVILTGRSSGGVSAVRSGDNALQGLVTSAATSNVPLLISTDQEGGFVQVLSGPGFSTIPPALAQGGETPATNQAQAQTWGAQLAAAGVALDLAPVLDTVPPGTAGNNPPIGFQQREYGFYTGTVAGHGTAVISGLAASGVASTGKHFPGLGRVAANTDFSSRVTDFVTTRGDAYLIPFTAAVHDNVPIMMVSTAYYARIDPGRRAAFSPIVIGTMLRGDLHFPGVVISDDLGNAAQVADLSPGARAVDFLAAGGDVVLTVNASEVPSMVQAVLARAATDSAFRAHIDAAALRVLNLKASLHLQASS